MNQDLALLPTCCTIYVSRSSKPAAFAGFNRLTPVASSSRQKGLVSSVGVWLLLGTIVWGPSVFHSSSIRKKLDSDLVRSGHGGRLSAPRRRMFARGCFFAVHGEVGVFHHVSPDITSFVRYFIQ